MMAQIKVKEEQVMIDIEKFICSLLADHPVGVTVRENIHKALKDQGLKYKGGKIVPIEDKTALKESEDERIRKNLIELFHDTVSNDEIFSDYGLEKTEVLAWLEKQGEHQKFRDSIQVGDKVTRNKDGILVNLSQLNRVAQKDNMQGEQNPTWSEKDEKIYSRICALIHSAAYKNYDVDEDGNECGEYANIKAWFKKLKDRVQPALIPL